MKFFLFVLSVLQILTLPAPAQSFLNASSHEFRGELVPVSAVPSECMLELKALSGSHSYRADVTLNGTFHLIGVARGRYKVEVKDGSGNVLKQEYLDVPVSYGTYMIQMPRIPASPTEGLAGAVSLRRLSHKVPKAARKQLDKAMKASSSGKPADAIRHLQLALEMDPLFVEAHNNLGVQCLKLNKVEEATAAFRAAHEIDPDSHQVQANLALALLTAGEPAEAERHAREALSNQPASAQARYMLGCAQFALKKELDDAAKNLSSVAAQFPRANLILGALLAHQGNHRQAEAKLKDYIGLANPQDKALATSLLSRLAASH